MVQVPVDRYNNKNPPKSIIDTEKELKVYTSVDLLDIIAIDEVASEISLMFTISFK